MRHSLFLPLVAGILFGSFLFSVDAEVTLPPIFSEHMILQKAADVPVWGRAAPGEDVAVSVAGQSARTKADADGKWRVNLNLAESGPGPFQMTVKGANQITVDDVLVGEVWLASGQSNMGAVLSDSTGAAQEIAGSANPQLRQFKVEQAASADPTEDYKGQWTVAGPDTSGRFTGVGYYFGKELQKALKVPVGIVNSSYGGTFCESWMSEKALAAEGLTDLQKKLAAQAANYPGDLKKYAEDFAAWEKQFGREDKPKEVNYAMPDASTADWKAVQLPAKFSSLGLPDAGVVWLRKEIVVPEQATGQPIRLDCGAMRDFATVYWNGVKVGETTPATPPGTESKFTYIIPPSLAKAGPTVLAVRVFTPRSDAALNASPAGHNFRLIFDSWTHFLAGDWMAKAEYELSQLEADAAQAMPSEPAAPRQAKNIPGYLYNGMIYPLEPYAVRGFIWYQGESNTEFARQYRKIFPALIRDWRAHWGRGNLPFYFCSLAAYYPMKPEPGDSTWAELREAQHLTTKLPNTGEAILIDLGEEKDIHPRNKKDAGERLAKVALRDTYGEKISATGPTYQSLRKAGKKIRLQFAHADGGLKARPVPAEYQPRSTEPETLPLVRNSPQSELEGFAICGSDRKWRWAEAKIEGSEVVVWSPEVPNPVAVRYAWADNPITNLYNGAGLPAVPFRTDDFPGVTSAKREN